MTLIRLSKAVSRSEELKRLFYWNAFMMNSSLEDEDNALDLILLTMIGMGGYGLDTIFKDRRCIET